MYNPNAFATLQSVGGGRAGLVPSSTIVPGSATAPGANNNTNAPTITVAGGIPLASVASPDGLERPVHPHPYFQEWMEFIKLIGHEEAKRLCPEQWSLLHGPGGLAKDMRENPEKYPHLTQSPAAVTSNSQAPFKSAPSVSSSNLDRESGRRRSRSPRDRGDHHRHHHRSSTSDRDKEDRKHHHHRSSRDERDKKDKKDKHHRSSHRDDDRDRRDKRDKYSRRD